MEFIISFEQLSYSNYSTRVPSREMFPPVSVYNPIIRVVVDFAVDFAGLELNRLFEQGDRGV